jgi:hypothetical protein
MKVVFFAVLFAATLIIGGTSIQSVSSQSLATVKVEASPSNPHVGETFKVTISLANVQNLYGIEVILKWNSSVIEATKIEPRLGIESYADGVLHESINAPSLLIAENNLTTSKDEYRLVATSTSPAPAFSGGGNIVTITFNPIATGSSQLIVQSELSDYPPTDRDPRVSQLIDHKNQNTAVTILASIANPTTTPQATQEPATSPSTMPTQANPSNTIKPQEENQWSDYALPLIAAILLLVLISVVLTYKLKRR